MTKTQTVSIKSVHPDENQPRKHFDVVHLANLQKSIKVHGIVNPITVEDHKDGYLIVDGERRYRCAVELGMKEVPVNILPARDAVTRLVEQFHIQEMHESWSPMEKAQVISDLCDSLQKPFREVCEILGISSRTAGKYNALTKLINRKEFSEKNVSLDFAENIHTLNNWVRDFKLKEMDESFTKVEQGKLEKKCIEGIKNGVLTNLHSFSKLKDIFRNDPTAIEKFMNGADVEQLYIKSKARSAYYLRNSVTTALQITSHINQFLSRPDTKMVDSDVSSLRQAKKKITELLSLAGRDE